eukprot:380356_1
MLTGASIFFIIVSGLITVISFIITIQTCKSYLKHSIWIVTFITMITFNLSQLACMVDFIVLHDTNQEINITSAAHLLFLFFYTAAQMMMLYLFIIRIENTVQETLFAYSPKTIKILKILWCCIIFLTLLVVAFIALKLGAILIFPVAILWALLFATLSVTILYLFLKKLYEIQSVIMSNDSTTDQQSAMQHQQEIFHLQLKLTVLASVAIASTIFAVFFGVLFGLIHTKYFYLIVIMPRFGLIIDSLFGFLSMAFTLKFNEKYYQISCRLCILCCTQIITKYNTKYSKNAKLPELNLTVSASVPQSKSNSVNNNMQIT